MKITELTFQAMVEATPCAIILVNVEGRIAYTNKHTNKLFGYNDNELYGSFIERLIPDRYKKGHLSFRDGFFANPVSRPMGAGRDLYAIKKDGTEFPVEIGLNPLITVDGTLVLASIIDILERKRAEEQFRRVVESAPNAMILVNNKGDIVLINKRAIDQFGYTQDELLGNKIEMIIPRRFREYHPKLREDFFRSPSERAMGAGRDLYALKKNGTEFPVEVGLNPIFMGKERFVIISVIDITERKTHEAKIKVYLDELKAKNKELEQFTYIASHDLQEPLRSVIGFVNLLKAEYGRGQEGNANIYFKYIEEVVGRMNNLVKGLLDYSRLGQNLELEELDCKQLVQAIFGDLGNVISKSNAEITIHNLPTVKGYKIELRLLFQNLISNAIKFCKSDFVPQIEISCQEEENFWKFCVKDNGIGISVEYKEKIFLIFQRLHNRNEYEGTGIGLSHCQKIVELHNGAIWVESKPDVGSSFYFTISKDLGD